MATSKDTSGDDFAVKFEENNEQREPIQETERPGQLCNRQHHPIQETEGPGVNQWLVQMDQIPQEPNRQHHPIQETEGPGVNQWLVQKDPDPQEPTQEMQEQDLFHHLRHLPPEVAEEYICRLEGTCRECMPVEETGSLDPYPLQRENYPQLIPKFSPTCTPI